MGIKFTKEDDEKIKAIVDDCGHDLNKALKALFDYQENRIKEERKKEAHNAEIIATECKKEGSDFKNDLKKLLLDFVTEITNFVTSERKLNEAIDKTTAISRAKQNVPTVKKVASVIIIDAIAKFLSSKDSATVFVYSEDGQGVLKYMEGTSKLLGETFASMITTDSDILIELGKRLDDYI